MTVSNRFFGFPPRPRATIFLGLFIIITIIVVFFFRFSGGGEHL
jgi:hypothetical protein